MDDFITINNPRPKARPQRVEIRNTAACVLDQTRVHLEEPQIPIAEWRHDKRRCPRDELKRQGVESPTETQTNADVTNHLGRFRLYTKPQCRRGSEGPI